MISKPKHTNSLIFLDLGTTEDQMQVSFDCRSFDDN